MIKFSIIVVSLNTKNKLENTLKSIIKQSLKSYEIVVIDGKVMMEQLSCFLNTKNLKKNIN